MAINERIKFKNASDDDDGLTNSTSRVGSDIFFFSEVNDESIMNLSEALRKSKKEHEERINKLLSDGDFNMTREQYKESHPIRIHINSPGGYVSAGIAGMNMIRSLGWPVHGYVQGDCSSAATFLLVVCNKRLMSKYASVLIHQLSSGIIGKLSDMEEHIESSKILMNQIKSIYLDNTKMKKTQIDKLASNELVCTPDDCLKLGIVDEVY